MAQNSAQVEHILATVPNKNDQIDAICEARGWKHVNTELRDVLDAYLDGNLSADETLDLLATPIEDSYSSADHGYLLWETECTARCLRPFFTAEKSLEFWGEPVAMCEPDPARVPQRRLKSQLRELYFTIIHVSRKQDWNAGDGHMKALVKLVQDLKARPDPLAPDNATWFSRKHWVCSNGALWSELCMLPQVATESYRDAPGAGGTMGFTSAEIRAWENENAFFALLTATGIGEFMHFGVPVMHAALEGGISREHEVMFWMTEESEEKWREVTLRVVVVWLEIAGEGMYVRVRFREGTEEEELGEFVASGMPSDREGEASAMRWRFWKRELGKIVRDEGCGEVCRGYAARALDRMLHVEALYASW
jgi:hypothetical protein